MTRPNWLIAGVALLAIVVGSGLALQRHANQELRDAALLLREQNRESDDLRAEHDRLMQRQISTAELERLRADHADLARLRDEVDQLRAHVQAMEQAEAK